MFNLNNLAGEGAVKMIIEMIQNAVKSGLNEVNFDLPIDDGIIQQVKSALPNMNLEFIGNLIKWK